jgi:DNA-binding response OmpR family regulator
MLTARGYHLEPQDTEQSGILRMLSKPFSPRQLLATVNDVLQMNGKGGGGGKLTLRPEEFGDEPEREAI